jgi:hypothetical protein
VKPALQARASREVEGAAETHFQDVDDTTAKPRGSPQAETLLQRWSARYAAMDGSKCFPKWQMFLNP